MTKIVKQPGMYTRTFFSTRNRTIAQRCCRLHSSEKWSRPSYHQLNLEMLRRNLDYRLGVFIQGVSVIWRSDYGNVKRTRRVQVYQPPHLKLFALMKWGVHCWSLVLLLQPLFRSFSFSSFRVRGGRERFLWRGIRPWRAFSMLYLPPQRQVRHLLVAIFQTPRSPEIIRPSLSFRFQI